MKYNEILSAETITPQIAARLEELREARTIVQKCLKTAPEGKLRVATAKDTFHYYFVNEVNSNGKYIPKENIDIAKGIAQKDYYEASLKAINNEIEFLSTTYKKYSAIDSNLVYDQLKNGRKPLVTPMHLTDKEYAKFWSNVEYRKKKVRRERTRVFHKQRASGKVEIGGDHRRGTLQHGNPVPIRISDFDTEFGLRASGLLLP